MIVVAVCIDGAQIILSFIPFLGWLVATLLGICGFFLFGIWFFHQGNNLFSADKVLVTLGTMLGELPPIINDMPWLTVRVTTAVFHAWSAGSTL